jgi:hypothetical protein
MSDLKGNNQVIQANNRSADIRLRTTSPSMRMLRKRLQTWWPDEIGAPGRKMSPCLDSTGK